MSALALLFADVSAVLDSDPATLPNWGVTVPALIMAVGLLFARDNDVTSEESGAAKKAINRAINSARE